MKIKDNEFWKVRIESCVCYYFDDIIELEGFHFYNILIDEKSQENILIYNSSYNTLIGAKPLSIRFNEINEFIRVYNGTRYLVLFGPEKYDPTYNRIRHLIGQKSGITYVFSLYYEKNQSWFLWFFTSGKETSIF